jgi:hypothetical protein
MEISIEIVKFNRVEIFNHSSDFNFELCKNCECNIFIDELLRHVICCADYIENGIPPHIWYNVVLKKVQCNLGYKPKMKKEMTMAESMFQNLKVPEEIKDALVVLWKYSDDMYCGTLSKEELMKKEMICSNEDGYYIKFALPKIKTGG